MQSVGGPAESLPRHAELKYFRGWRVAATTECQSGIPDCRCLAWSLVQSRS